MDRAARSVFLLALAFLAWGLVGGCGSKTGLDVPDAQIDAGPDAGPPPPPCIEVPRELPLVTLDLEIPASLRVVDIAFLIDSTGSMQDEIDAVREGLRRTVVPGVREIIPDAAFGVALFGEFPVSPHARDTDEVEPYALRASITTDVGRVESALDGTPVWGNLDNAEAAIEGLFQIATGAGLPPFIAPSVGCPMGGVGGACFRDEAFRIVMLVTDAPMHNGPPGVAPFEPYTFTPAPHTYEQAVEAAAAADLLVLGLGASDPSRPPPFSHLDQLARDTGSLDGAGRPLVFDIGSRGDRIGGEIVAAVRRVAEEVPLDVDAFVEDVPGDGVDALEIVRGIVAASATPPSGVVSIDGNRFTGVRPGTVLTFTLELDASGLPPSPERRVFPARVIFRESGRSRIDVRDILIVVPGDDGAGCDDLTGVL